MPDFLAPDGTRLYFSDSGVGPPILALAGLTRNSSDFDYVAPFLSGQRLIRMDYRGRGRSEWSGPDTYTIPTEARDAIALLDHLNIEKATILGTSRGGLIAMVLANTHRDRLSGICLVDIGPELSTAGLEVIKGYIGKNPEQRSYRDAAAARAKLMKGFRNVSPQRWDDEARKHFIAAPNGLKINYDPALRDAVLAAGAQPAPDLWPLFDALKGLPIALIHGANSDLLTQATVDEMLNRRPDMIYARVSDRGHVPFLDEPESLEALNRWLDVINGN